MRTTPTTMGKATGMTTGMTTVITATRTATVTIITPRSTWVAPLRSG